MKNDRNYYRMLDDNSLINEGRDSMNELAIVLADRLGELQDAEDRLKEAQQEIVELTARWDRMREEIEEQQITINTLMKGTN